MPRRNRHHEIPQVCMVTDRLEKVMTQQVAMKSKELALLLQISEDIKKLVRMMEGK